MNDRQLEYLRLVLRAGSFGQAAQEAGVSQPAISQALAALAREVGHPLFEREGRRCVPTARALAMAQAGARVQDAWSEVRRSARQAHRPASPPVPAIRGGMAPAAGLLYGPALVAAVATFPAPPLLTITTGAADRMLQALLMRELDFVIAPRPRGFRSSGIRRQVMYVSRPMVYARIGHPLAGARHLGEIAGAHWAVASSAGAPGNVVEEAFRVRRWPPPRIAVQCGDYAILLRLIATSDLLGVISHPALVPDAAAIGLVAIPVAEGLPHYEVCLFRHAAATAAGLDRLLAALDAADAGQRID
ncbi:LysR family transcriptional regulator [Ramlibacter sp. AW1]|uniref:LysR family transcriptional regulator n=1 Tax=Ramlibacter aurantiacus TaxID=2801330 RepID=A0A937D2I6_9BURK|nr:LysR family transcriptional regulator [Ramlibacter aurantiacus]MBL0421654.1 LysR family transcriptional regulator [Ramlibacter aurantiacus]